MISSEGDYVKTKVARIAQMIDHAVLHPTATDEDLIEGCRIARKYKVASVCCKPYAVLIAKEHLEYSKVKVATVIGYPHGGTTIDTKVAETFESIRLGAKEIDAVINIGKALQGDWRYVEEEIASVVAICRQFKVQSKIIFETAYLSNEQVAKLSMISAWYEADFVKTSTGFGFVKENNEYIAKGASLEHCKIMLENIPLFMNVKASGGINSFKDVLDYRNLGVARIGCSATEKIMEEAIAYYTEIEENRNRKISISPL